jgi:hypothetical protein
LQELKHPFDLTLHPCEFFMDDLTKAGVVRTDLRLDEGVDGHPEYVRQPHQLAYRG